MAGWLSFPESKIELRALNAQSTIPHIPHLTMAPFHLSQPTYSRHVRRQWCQQPIPPKSHRVSLNTPTSPLRQGHTFSIPNHWGRFFSMDELENPSQKNILWPPSQTMALMPTRTGNQLLIHVYKNILQFQHSYSKIDREIQYPVDAMSKICQIMHQQYHPTCNILPTMQKLPKLYIVFRW